MYNFGVYHVCGYYTMNCSAMTWYIYAHSGAYNVCRYYTIIK